MNGSKRDHSTIDIANDADQVLASSLEKMMSHNSFISSKCSIFKTPSILFRHDRKAYLPDAFSIGPLHHGKRHLKDAEKIKLQYLHGLISRAPTKETSLKNFIKAIREVEREARQCYAVPLDNLSVDDLVKILVLDGCFIIELLRKYSHKVPENKEDPVFGMSCILEFLAHDLILLENQIPWKVLDCLFSITVDPHKDRESLHKLAINFLSWVFTTTTDFTVDRTNHEIKHMLDLLRKTLVLPSKLDQSICFGRWKLIPSATSLAQAGIKFKTTDDSSSILDIKFSNINGVLEIPPLTIDETTGAVLRNLISFEQCFYRCTDRITSYAIVLANLITTKEDLCILCQHGIIDNMLNPEAVIQFLKELYHDTCFNNFYYANLCEDVNKHCGQGWPRLRALYVHNFTNPWAIVSQVVGGIALLLTLLQTIYSIKK